MNYRLHFPLIALCLVACAPVSEQPPPRPDWTHGAMVVAANPAAVDAALAVLADGGHAVDAAIAAHAVLGLVEPESSGIGGSAFMLVYDRGADSLVVFDGRETAPTGATPGMLTRDGQRIGFGDLWGLGVTVGVPGAVAVYEAAHRRFGRSPWGRLFDPAIQLATDGFVVTEKLTRYNDYIGPLLATGNFPEAANFLMPGGNPLAAGDVVMNSAYAESLSAIANHGARAFYEQLIATSIVERAAQPPAGSTMLTADLAAYKAIERDAVCGDFRVYSICSAPPPASGIAVISMPVLYDHLRDTAKQGRAEQLSSFVDAQRLGYADRDQYIADPAFVEVPAAALLNPAYLKKRASERFRPAEKPSPGDPLAVSDRSQRPVIDAAFAGTFGTTHLSIIDAEGNAVSMTASVGFPFGSLRMTRGFFLNNELTDFSTADSLETESINAVAPGKRPRSSMSPTIVFDANGEPLMLTGSAGGSSIIAYAVKTILGVLDWNLSAQDAVDFPNIVARGETVGVEVSAAGGDSIAAELAERNYAVGEGGGENSGLHVIVVRPDGLEGAADSRRHGSVGRLD